jgi:hypothetical protein
MALVGLGAAMAAAGGGFFVYKGAEKNKVLKQKANRESIPGYYKDASFEITDPTHISYDANQAAVAFKSGIYGLPKTVTKGTDQHGHTNVWGTKDGNSYWARKET